MNAAEAAKFWMLLKTEQSLGLKSVPWKLARPRPVATGAAATRSPVTPALRTVAQTARPVQKGAPEAMRPVPVAVAPRAHPVTTMPKGIMEETLGGTVLPLVQREQILRELNEKQVQGCTKCRLCEQRTQTVFGEGSLEAQLFFIGEGPGETEDQTGRPFVGRAGQLLTKMIIAMGLSREQVFIGNVVKCRPPGNRTPQPDEVATCTPYLVKQLEVIRPKVIVTLGLPATQYMLQTDQPMRSLRGVWQQWRGIKLMPTYHPSYVLRSYTPQVRGAVWSDLQKVMEELGLPMKKAGM